MPTDPQKQLKIDFIRNLPEGTTAGEACRKAKAAGLLMTAARYYDLRREMAAAKPATARKPVTNGSSMDIRLTSSNPSEQAVLDAVEALGAARVWEVLKIVDKLQREVAGSSAQTQPAAPSHPAFALS